MAHTKTLVAQTVKYLSTMWETRVRSLGWEDPLEKEMAIHSRTIAWTIHSRTIAWTEEPGRLQSMGSQRVGHDWATLRSLSLYKDPDAGKDWRQEEKEMTEDKMVGWPHQLDGHEFEQALGVGLGQGSLACCMQSMGLQSQTRLSDWTKLNWRVTSEDCQQLQGW